MVSIPLHHHHHHLLLLLSLLLPLTTTSTPPPPQSPYETLKLHGLPVGLFPKGINTFHIDQTGHFQFLLASACNARFENQVHYETNVSGIISYGMIGGLSGMSAQDLFLWFPVKGVRVDVPSSGVIYFDVGVVKKRFSVGMFDAPPDCYSEEGVDRVVYKNANMVDKEIYKKAVL